MDWIALGLFVAALGLVALWMLRRHQEDKAWDAQMAVDFAARKARLRAKLRQSKETPAVKPHRQSDHG